MLLFISILVVTLFTIGYSQEDVIPKGYEQSNIIVEHSILGKEFSERVNIVLLQKHTGKLDLRIDFLEDHVNGISTSEIEDFKIMLSKNSLYRIRMHSQPGNTSSPFVIAAIPVCELQKSGFKEEIRVHTDKANNIIGFEYYSPVTALPRPCDPRKIDKQVNFTTKVVFVAKNIIETIPLTATGPRPAELQKIRLGIEEEKKAASNNQSFLMKYWYIILPVTLAVMFGGNEPEKKGEGAAAGGAGTTTATAK